MSQQDNFDVESFRNPYESNTEWRMRREFLLAHYDKLDIDRLVCLANCYVNVEIYGCRYPDRVHVQLDQLTENLELDTKGPVSSRIKGMQKINFVKSSETEQQPAKDPDKLTPSDFDSLNNTASSTSQDIPTSSDPKSKMNQQFTHGGSLQSVPEQMTADAYADFQRAMNDSGVSLSGDVPDPSSNQFHYHGAFQKYGDDKDVSRQVEDYLKQWAEYYESQHGHDPKIRYDYKTFQNTEDPEGISKNIQGTVSDLPEPTPPPQVKKKIGIVNPNFNFVKASSEFKSTDISEKHEEKAKSVMIPAILAGKNRMGLGATGKKGATQKAPMINFIQGGKGLAYLETQFNNLCREIKTRNAADRNPIDVIHQSVNKCKMHINDLYHTNDRMPDGRVKYTCNIEINNVFISTGGAPSKKVAKSEAYSKALNLLANPPVAIKQKSEEELYLVQKIEIGPQKPETPAASPLAKNQNIPNNQQNKAISQKMKEVPTAKDNEKTKETYAKPKMVFHKAGEPVKTEEPPAPTTHPLSNKPLEFKKAEEPGEWEINVLLADAKNSVSDSKPTSVEMKRPETNFSTQSPAVPSQGRGRLGFGRGERVNQGGQFNKGDRGNRFGHGGQFDNRGNRGRMPFQRQSDRFDQGYDRHGYDMPYYRCEERGYTPHYDEYDARNYGRPDDQYDEYNDYSNERYGDFGYDTYNDDDFGRYNHSHNRRADFERKEFHPAGHGSQKREGDRFSAPSAVKKVRKSGNVVLEDVSDFIIMDYSKLNSNVNATSILHNSANFNRVVLKYQFEEISGFGWRCKLLISDEVVASSFGSNREDAKKAAGEEALSMLQEKCYTIKVKQDVDNDEDEGMTKDEFLGEVMKGGNIIPDSNIGNMLLRKMGWAGGGVGKHGTGIAEPIKADQVIGREGLGLTASKGIDKSFHDKVEKMLIDYTRSNEQNDLHFSPEFTKEERAVIHKAAQKYGLKSHSKGKDSDRFLIISRKRSAPQLLDHVMNSGGTTSKYEVIPPKSQQEEDEYFARDRQAVWDAMSYGHGKQ